MQENAEQTVYSHSQPHPPPPLSELGVKCTGPKLRTYPVERQYVWLMPRIALFLTEMELSKTKSFNHQLLLTYQHRSNRKKVQKWMIGVNRPLPPFNMVPHFHSHYSVSAFSILHYVVALRSISQRKPFGKHWLQSTSLQVAPLCTRQACNNTMYWL